MSSYTGESWQLPPVVDGPRAPDRPQAWSRSDRRWDRVRHILVMGWLLLIVAAPLVGERTASWDDVRSLVAAGEVGSVRLSGELPVDATGYGVVEVHWRHGPLRYMAQVLQVHGRGWTPEEEATTKDDHDVSAVLHASPSSRLAALQPGLRVTRDERLSAGGRLLGWHVPNAVAIPAFLLFVAGLVVLIAGPQPWRATRWAWFWLLLPPLGCLLFLTLSGPTVGVPAPRDPDRRLTGGWAFLLSLPLMAVLAPHW